MLIGNKALEKQEKEPELSAEDVVFAKAIRAIDGINSQSDTYKSMAADSAMEVTRLLYSDTEDGVKKRKAAHRDYNRYLARTAAFDQAVEIIRSSLRRPL